MDQAKITALRSEVEAAGGDRARQAMLTYEIGRTIEDGGGGEAAAVREYLGAYNLDPSFRPPLFELVRMFERRRSFKNLARLYEAELKSATTPAERASALLDRASLLEDHLAQPEAAAPLYEQAAAEDPDGVAALLMLERRARLAGDAATALAALAQRVERCKSPALRTVLGIELARDREREGDVDGAIEALKLAVRSGEERTRALAALEEIARRNGRVAELVAALEARAALEAGTEASRGDAVVSWLESARLRLDRLGDAEGAKTSLDKALAVAPEDLTLRRAHMLAVEATGDLASSAEDARAIEAAAGEGGSRAPLFLRLAEAAQAAGDVAAARAALDSALAAAPASAALRAMHDDLSLALGEIDVVVGRLEAEAASAEGEPRATLLARAGSFLAHVAGDPARACDALSRAADASAEPAPIVREMLAVALGAGDDGLVRTAIEKLLGITTDAEERAALHHARVSILARAGASNDERFAAIEAAVADGGDWAITRMRIDAAVLGDHARLARAHELRAAKLQAEADVAAAHLVAAARAHARAKNDDAATACLKAALEKAPGHRYAVGLLEEIYRRKGDADAVVRILREAAEADTTGRAREAQLLVAGAAAEAAGDLDLAQRTYEEALAHDGKAVGPLLALRALAEKRGDGAREAAVLASLAEHELSNGTGGRYNLELGEHHLDVAHDVAAAEPSLRAALDTKETRLAAALDLALVPAGTSGAARADALAALVAGTSGPTRTAFAHELLGEALAQGDAALAGRAVAVLEPGDDAPPDALARLAASRVTSGDPTKIESRARAVERLAQALGEAPAAAELMLHGTRLDLLARNEETEAILVAGEIADRAPGSIAAAIATVEALGEEDEAGERADALLSWAAHTSGGVKASLEAGAARLLALSGRTEEALPLLRAIVEREPEDLASFEMIRVAARDEQAWEDVVVACDKLAEATEGELRAQLLEEASAVLMDNLEDDARAEPRLRAALALDPGRPIAYARLHDVLADRGDEEALLELVGGRIDVTDEPADLAPLFYEQARLHRSLGDYEGALASLENLLLLESEHLGGLALLVEIHVQREQFAEAVDALRQIATAEGVPASQRRIARLGAADFLDKKLDDVTGALAELRAIEEMGLGDRVLFERTASLAERVGDLERASEALERAAEVERDFTKKAAVERRLARLELETRGRREHALAAYRRALRALPTDLESLRSASALISDAMERRMLTELPEQAFRVALASKPLDTDTLRALWQVAEARGDRALRLAVSKVLLATGAASDDEIASIDDDAELARVPSPTPALGDARLGLIVPSPLVGPAAGAVGEIALAVVETLVEGERLEPSSFGMQKTDLGKPGMPLVDEVLAVAAKLGAPAGDVWVGGRDPQGVTVIANYKGKPAWIIGSAAGQLPPAERRFRIGALALGLRLGLGPLATRAIVSGGDEVANQLYGLAVAGGVPFAAAEGRAGLSEASRALGKMIGRKARRTVTEAAPKVGDAGRPIVAWSRALVIALARAGALAAGDPGPAFGLVELERGAPGALDAFDVGRFWTADTTLALRRELGLAG